MKQQLSLEVLLSISVSIMIVGFGYAAYSHAIHNANSMQAEIAHYANASEYYSWILSNMCKCMYR